MMMNQAAAKAKNHRMKGSFAPENHIIISCVMSWLPRVKLPALRWTLPSALCWFSGMAPPLVGRSLSSMIFRQALVGLPENLVPIFRHLVAAYLFERYLLPAP